MFQFKITQRMKFNKNHNFVRRFVVLPDFLSFHFHVRWTNNFSKLNFPTSTGSFFFHFTKSYYLTSLFIVSCVHFTLFPCELNGKEAFHFVSIEENKNNFSLKKYTNSGNTKIRNSNKKNRKYHLFHMYIAGI